MLQNNVGPDKSRNRPCNLLVRASVWLPAMSLAAGLTFGTISSLCGLTAGIIDVTQFSLLVTVVVLSAEFRPPSRSDGSCPSPNASDELIDDSPTPGRRSSSDPGSERLR